MLVFDVCSMSLSCYDSCVLWFYFHWAWHSFLHWQLILFSYSYQSLQCTRTTNKESEIPTWAQIASHGFAWARPGLMQYAKPFRKLRFLFAKKTLVLTHHVLSPPQPGWVFDTVSACTVRGSENVSSSSNSSSASAGYIDPAKTIGGWEEGPYREIVSFRSCVRTCGVHCLVGNDPNGDPDLFPFPFAAGGFPFSLEIESEIKMNSLRNPMWTKSEFKVCEILPPPPILLSNFG